MWHHQKKIILNNPVLKTWDILPSSQIKLKFTVIEKLNNIEEASQNDTRKFIKPNQRDKTLGKIDKTRQNINEQKAEMLYKKIIDVGCEELNEWEVKEETRFFKWWNNYLNPLWKAIKG